MDSYSEEKLVTAGRNADSSAYAALVKAYSSRVFAICLAMLGNRDDAEDIAQQVFLKGYSDLNRLRKTEKFGAWIGRIVKNLCIDFIRSKQRQRCNQNCLAEQAAITQEGPKEYPELTAALAKLPEDYRLVLMLYYFDGRSTQRIAEILDISDEAVRTRMSRARKQLRRLLENAGGK